mgnify:CR=1 FL=1
MTAHIDPERAAFEAFKALGRDEPVEMLNLIKLRETAAYAEGRAQSGLEAYKAYGRHSGPIFQRVGGTIIWRGTPQLMLTGPQAEHWDLVFIARYPTASAFLEMVTDTVYQSEAVPHRQAAVADSRLIRCAPADAGAGFA